MNYKGKNLDPVRLWENYVSFPSSLKRDDGFAPKVPCPNPEHDTLKSHFQVNLHQPTVHCFAHCGISGDYAHAICVVEGLYDKFKVDQTGDEREKRRRELRARREADKIIRRAASGKATKFSLAGHTAKVSKSSPAAVAVDLRYERFLPQAALEYLAQRGISDHSVAQWGLGWDADDLRLVIPALDEQGKLRFLVKRSLRSNASPKYLYTEGYPKSRLLFGACQIDRGMIRSAGMVIVEGSIDTILSHQHGLRNTVGILGTGISEYQRRIIARINPPKVYLFFDKDTAGVRNIEIAASVLRKYPLYVVRYPKGRSDPAEMTAEEKARQVSRAIPLRRFVSENNLTVKRARGRISIAD